jgi:hypothetical protein
VPFVKLLLADLPALSKQALLQHGAYATAPISAQELKLRWERGLSALAVSKVTASVNTPSSTKMTPTVTQLSEEPTQEQSTLAAHNNNNSPTKEKKRKEDGEERLRRSGEEGNERAVDGSSRQPTTLINLTVNSSAQTTTTTPLRCDGTHTSNDAAVNTSPPAHPGPACPPNHHHAGKILESAANGRSSLLGEVGDTRPQMVATASNTHEGCLENGDGHRPGKGRQAWEEGRGCSPVTEANHSCETGDGIIASSAEGVAAIDDNVPRQSVSGLIGGDSREVRYGNGHTGKDSASSSSSATEEGARGEGAKERETYAPWASGRTRGGEEGPGKAVEGRGGNMESLGERVSLGTYGPRTSAQGLTLRLRNTEKGIVFEVQNSSGESGRPRADGDVGGRGKAAIGPRDGVAAARATRELDLRNHDATSTALLSLLGRANRGAAAPAPPSTDLACALLAACRSPDGGKSSRQAAKWGEEK